MGSIPSIPFISQEPPKPSSTADEVEGPASSSANVNNIKQSYPKKEVFWDASEFYTFVTSNLDLGKSFYAVGGGKITSETSTYNTDVMASRENSKVSLVPSEVTSSNVILASANNYSRSGSKVRFLNGVWVGLSPQSYEGTNIFRGGAVGKSVGDLNLKEKSITLRERIIRSRYEKYATSCSHQYFNDAFPTRTMIVLETGKEKSSTRVSGRLHKYFPFSKNVLNSARESLGKKKNSKKAEEKNEFAPPVGFTFSPAGLLLPYHLGVIAYLKEVGVINDSVPLSGASAGALAIVSAACGIPPLTSMHGVEALCKNARENGTLNRLHDLVDAQLRVLLSEDAPQKISNRKGKVTVSLTQVIPFRGIFVSSFYSKNDIIECLLASCNVPFIFSKWPVVNCRGKGCVDGYFAVPRSEFGCPPTEARRDIKIIPFSAKAMKLGGSFSGDLISPDLKAKDLEILEYLKESYTYQLTSRPLIYTFYCLKVDDEVSDNLPPLPPSVLTLLNLEPPRYILYQFIDCKKLLVSRFSLKQLLRIALDASEDAIYRELFDLGRIDAFRWIILEYIALDKLLKSQWASIVQVIENVLEFLILRSNMEFSYSATHVAQSEANTPENDDMKSSLLPEPYNSHSNEYSNAFIINEGVEFDTLELSNSNVVTDAGNHLQRADFSPKFPDGVNAIFGFTEPDNLKETGVMKVSTSQVTGMALSRASNVICEETLVSKDGDVSYDSLQKIPKRPGSITDAVEIPPDNGEDSFHDKVNDQLNESDLINKKSKKVPPENITAVSFSSSSGVISSFEIKKNHVAEKVNDSIERELNKASPEAKNASVLSTDTVTPEEFSVLRSQLCAGGVNSSGDGMQTYNNVRNVEKERELAILKEIPDDIIARIVLRRLVDLKIFPLDYAHIILNLDNTFFDS